MVSGRSCKHSNLDRPGRHPDGSGRRQDDVRTAPGGVRAASGRLRTAPGGVRTAPDGSGRLLVGPRPTLPPALSKSHIFTWWYRNKKPAYRKQTRTTSIYMHTRCLDLLEIADFISQNSSVKVPKSYDTASATPQEYWKKRKSHKQTLLGLCESSIWLHEYSSTQILDKLNTENNYYITLH